MNTDQFVIRVVYLMLIRKGLATKEEQDDILSRLQSGMLYEDVYKVFDEKVKQLEEEVLHSNVPDNFDVEAFKKEWNKN